MKTKLYVDMDGVLADFDKLRDIEKSESNPFPQARVGFFLDLEPIEDAVDSVCQLGEKYEILFLTRPSIKNNHCWSEKAAWIEKYFGRLAVDNLIITCRKDLLADGISYLIDDMPNSSGQAAFGEMLILFDAKDKMRNWKTITRLLMI